MMQLTSAFNISMYMGLRKNEINEMHAFQMHVFQKLGYNNIIDLKRQYFENVEFEDIFQIILWNIFV